MLEAGQTTISTRKWVVLESFMPLINVILEGVDVLITTALLPGLDLQSCQLAERDTID